MAFGLTETGFNKKTLTDVKSEIDEKVKAVFGAANVDPDSVFGQYDGIIAEVVADLWDLADKVYSSQYALSALGVSLDAVTELNNLTRLAATPSTAIAILFGDGFTLVPADTEIRQTGTDEIFKTTAAVTLGNSEVLKAVFSVNDVSIVPHSITLQTPNGDVTAYTNGINTTINDVLTDLRDQINTTAKHAAVLDPDLEQLTITNIDFADLTTFSISWSGSMDKIEAWNPVSVESLSVGALSVPANSLQIIETPVSGLNEVDNLSAGVQGRETETDDDFRIRRKQSIRVVGAATVPAIESRLVEEIDSVVSASVKDNRTDLIDLSGRPPHSFEAIVTFSPDTPEIRQEIANKLFEVGPAGIETVGNISEQVIDSSGDILIINFSQPTTKYLHITATISLNPEEIFPLNGIDAIKTALADFGNDLNAGEDAIRQRFFNSIYSVSGVKDVVTFNFATTLNPGDAPAILSTDSITGEPEPGLYDLAGATLIADGLISGMVVQLNSGAPFTSAKQVLSETQFRANEDIYGIGQLISFGAFGPTNIGINANEIARFDVSRIAIAIV